MNKTEITEITFAKFLVKYDAFTLNCHFDTVNSRPPYWLTQKLHIVD